MMVPNTITLVVVVKLDKVFPGRWVMNVDPVTSRLVICVVGFCVHIVVVDAMLLWNYTCESIVLGGILVAVRVGRASSFRVASRQSWS